MTEGGNAGIADEKIERQGEENHAENLRRQEPVAGMPSSESHIILEAIAALPSQIAVLIIEHDMDIVFRFAQTITVLAQGAVLASGAPRDIAANPEVKAVYLGELSHG